jgi:hypothetical protein
LYVGSLCFERKKPMPSNATSSRVELYPLSILESRPRLAWKKPDGTWQPSTTNFTSLADPAAIGSGKTALTTLMHEAGHAAHFANIKQPSPLFAQERAPMSVAYAENQVGLSSDQEFKPFVFVFSLALCLQFQTFCVSVNCQHDGSLSLKVHVSRFSRRRRGMAGKVR